MERIQGNILDSEILRLTTHSFFVEVEKVEKCKIKQ